MRQLQCLLSGDTNSSVGAFILAFVDWIVAMGLLAQPHAWALFTGLALQLFAGDAVTIRLNLYVFDNVSRARLTQFEPMRMFLAGIGWITGPLAGAYISTRLASWAPFLLSTGFFLAMYVTSACHVRSNLTAS